MPACGVAAIIAGCTATKAPGPVELQAVVLSSADVEPAGGNGLELIAPRNGFAEGLVQARGVGLASAVAIQVDPFERAGGAGTAAGPRPTARVFQLRPESVDLDSADYVRLTGQSTAPRTLPRVLFPLERRGDSFVLPPGPAVAAEPVFWIEVHVPAGTPAGRYRSDCSVTDAAGRAVGRVPVQLDVSAAELPAVPQLVWWASLDSLTRVFPGLFDEVPPRLLNRSDPAAGPAVALLDQLQRSAHAHRVVLTVPALSPTVKWSPDGTPDVDWSDYDSLVTPWLDGSAFDDHVGVAAWRLPAPAGLDRLGAAAQQRYRAAVIEHFRRAGWLDRCTLAADEPTFADGLVSASPARPGDCLDARQTADRSDQDPLQMRTWGWLAYVSGAKQVQGGDALDSARAPWFVPGAGYGSAEPLETVQLQWARQAEQDDELLSASPAAVARPLAQLIVKPVQLPAGMAADGESLWGGTEDRAAWAAAERSLAAGSVTPADLRRLGEQARPAARVTAVQFTPTKVPDQLAVSVEAEAFHPVAPSAPDSLAWAAAPPGWHAKLAPSLVPFTAPGANVGTGRVSATVSLNEISPGQPAMVQLLLSSPSMLNPVQCGCVLPIAHCQHRDAPVELDGSLSDWGAADALVLNQPLIQMASRPAARRGVPVAAATASSVFSAWDRDALTVAFRFEGVGGTAASSRNFVRYDGGRAWGEDLAELLIQPVGIDGKPGPLLHVVCKPGGGSWVERADDGVHWNAAGVTELRYACSLDPAQHVWRGEVAIPWSSLQGEPTPSLLRFNVAQHRQATGESASWAGPIDRGRDTRVMGLLVLRGGSATP